MHEAKVATEVEAIAETLRRFARSLARVALEAGPLSPWLHGGLHGAGFAVICIETRHLKASLGAMRNKTDRNDARGIAQITKSDDERVRLGAIQAALDRGWGKPTQAVDLGGEMAITRIERVIVDSANRDR